MYDERAVAFVRRIDHLISAKAASARPANRELGALLNALEIHVEDGDGHPDIVTGFERLFCDLASVRRLDAKTIATAKKLFNDLRQHLHKETAGM